LVTHSEDFTDASWFKEGLLGVPSAVYNSLTGVTNAYELTENSATSTQHRAFQSITISSGAEYTVSVYVKRGVGSRQFALLNVNAGSRVYFDLNSGTVGDETNGTGKIVDVGGGWFHCSATGTSTNTSTALYLALCDGTTTGSETYNGDGTSSILIYGAQLEQGQVVNGTPVDAPTPSSYIPTNGSTVTRGGQSLVVPPAEFGWPEPEYIGPELVDNGGFDTDTVWTDRLGASTGGTVVITGGELVITQGSNSVWMGATQAIDVTGIDYVLVTAELVSTSSSNPTYVRVGLSTSDGTSGAPNMGYMQLSVGYNELPLDVSGVSTVYILVMDGQGATNNSHVDNISVREINPLSVSIQMDGRMTYADEGINGRHSGGEIAEVGYYSWNASSAEWISARLDTADIRTGSVVLRQTVGPASPNDTYTPGINVPFNIASRHGSTFINGAVDGVALTEDTTPTALPDLSNTDLAIAYDFMGTIGTFRQFAGDIGDAGLVTATNPSTEPTLSLTFDGTEGSFYNLSWSE
jgi:hypothetical protein